MLAHNFNLGLRTQDVQISEDVTFETMLLSPTTLQGLRKAGFYKPSPIQLHGIPMGKCGFDLLLEAKSGTGKTIVFTVITLEKIDLEKGLQTIVLAPTREIASQIKDVIEQIGSNMKDLQVEVVMGGLPFQDDIDKFKNNVHIVVGSPGRLKHLIQDNHIDTSSVRLLVLDEADKLMEKSFQKDIQYIFSVLPQQKQVIMSSATYPENSKSLIDQYVKYAQKICPNSSSILLGIEQKVTVVKFNKNIVRQTQNKFKELINILSEKQFKQALIFCNYQARVAELYKMLQHNKWPAQQLYGNQEQTDRLDALKTLQEYKCRILISTDLVARGIDASNVDLVINFESPLEWQTYLHRIGRAGRFGTHGIAISILSEGQEIQNFQKLICAITIPVNINYLWTNEPFELNYQVSESCQIESMKSEVSNLESEQKPETNNNKNIQTDNLKTLCNKVFNYEKLIEEMETKDLERLCQPYKKPDIKINSFSDLMQSFISHTSGTGGQHLETQKTLIDNGISPKKNHDNSYAETSNFKNENKIAKNMEIKDLETWCKYLENLNLNHNVKSQSFSDQIQSIDVNEPNNPTDESQYCNHLEIPTTPGMLAKNPSHNSDIIISTESSIVKGEMSVDVVKQSSNEFCEVLNKNRDEYVQTFDSDIVEKHDELCNPMKAITKEKKGKHKAHSSLSHLFENKEYSKNSPEISTAPVAFRKPKISRSRRKNSKENKEYKRESSIHSRCSTSQSHHYKRHHNVRGREYDGVTDASHNRAIDEYDDWYDQLKFRMWQYELAVYIKEMSK